jgi:heme-degrading monooxygenase HmoA
MIGRIWRGRTPAAASDAYLAFIDRVAVPEYRSTPGNRGVLVLRREVGEVAEFTLLTLWDSMDAIRGFAGDDPERAKYYPEDPEFLLEMPPDVEHFEVATRDLD